MDLKIISSTDRPNSKSLEVSNYVKSLYKKEGINPGVISLEDFPLSDVVGGVYGDKITSIQNFRDPILEADALLFVIPEYNGLPRHTKNVYRLLTLPGCFRKNSNGFCWCCSGGIWRIKSCRAISNGRKLQECNSVS